MPKQILELVDYLSPLAVGGVFMLTLIVLSIFCLNWCFIQQTDDITALERWGYEHKVGMKLGVHNKAFIQKSVTSQGRISADN